MIQKRYEHYTKRGIEFSSWFDYCEDNNRLQTLQKEEKWQTTNKLKNEFRVV